MGKGIIVEGGSKGLYQVQLVYDRSRIASSIARIDQQIANINSWLAAHVSPSLSAEQIRRARIEIAALRLRKKLFENCPGDKFISAWCADFTEDLTGDVGTIEIPGEYNTGKVNIQPGYGGNAAYNSARDGTLQHALAGTPASVFWNLAMLPGWQKWKPTYRYGTITALRVATTEEGIDYCDVALDSTTSSSRGGSLGINQNDVLTNARLKYMDCHGAAFKVDDKVIVAFSGQDFAEPWVIGYKDNPKPCHDRVVITIALTAIAGEAALDKKIVFVWDPKNNILERAAVADTDTEYLAWLAGRNATGISVFSAFSLDIIEPHKLAPELIDTVNMDYHANGVDGTVFPRTIYGQVLLPATDIPYSGLRTSKATEVAGSSRHKFALSWADYQWIENGYGEMVLAQVGSGGEYGYWTGDWGTGDYPDALWYEPRMIHRGGDLWDPPGVGIAWWPPLYAGEEYNGTTTKIYAFFGPLGLFNSFEATNTSSGWVAAVTMESNTEEIFIPQWMPLDARPVGMEDDEWALKSKQWYSGDIKGVYSDKTMAIVCMVQYTPCVYTATYINEPRVSVDSWSSQSRVVAVQAQALYQRAGIAGYDWVAASRNAAFEAQIIAAINMAYSLNGVPANEIRTCAIGVEIMR